MDTYLLIFSLLAASAQAAVGLDIGLKAKEAPIPIISPERVLSDSTTVLPKFSVFPDFSPKKIKVRPDLKAIIIPDFENKRNTKGFFTMTVLDYEGASEEGDPFFEAVENLMGYMRANTRINARLQGEWRRLTNADLFKVPLLYLRGWDAKSALSEQEKRNLGFYLKKEGCLFAETPTPAHFIEPMNKPSTQADAADSKRYFKALINDPLVMGPSINGGEAKWVKVPQNHKLYHSFFDQNVDFVVDGVWSGLASGLEMLVWQGRVVAIFSDRNISRYWGNPLKETLTSNHKRGLQFGVNLIVFVLTQSGKEKVWPEIQY